MTIGERQKTHQKANRIIDASLTVSVLRYMFIDKMGDNVDVWVVPENQAIMLPAK